MAKERPSYYPHDVRGVARRNAMKGVLELDPSESRIATREIDIAIGEYWAIQKGQTYHINSVRPYIQALPEAILKKFKERVREGEYGKPGAKDLRVDQIAEDIDNVYDLEKQRDELRAGAPKGRFGIGHEYSDADRERLDELTADIDRRWNAIGAGPLRRNVILQHYEQARRAIDYIQANPEKVEAYAIGRVEELSKNRVEGAPKRRKREGRYTPEERRRAQDLYERATHALKEERPGRKPVFSEVQAKAHELLAEEHGSRAGFTPAEKRLLQQFYTEEANKHEREQLIERYKEDLEIMDALHADMEEKEAALAGKRRSDPEYAELSREHQAAKRAYEAARDKLVADYKVDMRNLPLPEQLPDPREIPEEALSLIDEIKALIVYEKRLNGRLDHIDQTLTAADPRYADQYSAVLRELNEIQNLRKQRSAELKEKYDRSVFETEAVAIFLERNAGYAGLRSRLGQEGVQTFLLNFSYEELEEIARETQRKADAATRDEEDAVRRGVIERRLRRNGEDPAPRRDEARIPTAEARGEAVNNLQNFIKEMMSGKVKDGMDRINALLREYGTTTRNDADYDEGLAAAIINAAQQLEGPRSSLGRLEPPIERRIHAALVDELTAMRSQKKFIVDNLERVVKGLKNSPEYRPYKSALEALRKRIQKFSKAL